MNDRIPHPMHQKLSPGAFLDEHSDLLDHAVESCRAIVRKNVSRSGLAASVDNYPQIWARDTVITFFGATVSHEPRCWRHSAFP